MELVTAKQRKEEESPVVWAMELGQCVAAAPSIELGEVVVSQLCFHHNKPSLWKFLDLSLSSGLLSPLHVLSILSSRFGPSSLSISLFQFLSFPICPHTLSVFCRVIPQRRSQPEAYRLFLELLRRYAFSFGTISGNTSKEK